VTRNEIILGVFALVLVLFSLVVSLVVPRRDPGFPGRNLRLFVVVAVLLVVGMLAAVEVFGAEHETEEGQAEEAKTTETTGETGQTGETQTDTGGVVEGDPAAGREVFTSTAQPPCGSCHTLEAAGTTQTVGPNLDETLGGKDAAFIRESIVNPDAEVAEGFSEGLMPGTYGDQLSDEELANLVAFLVQSTSG
jgi:mono/diheme cytochrome c family protein